MVSIICYSPLLMILWRQNTWFEEGVSLLRTTSFIRLKLCLIADLRMRLYTVDISERDGRQT